MVRWECVGCGYTCLTLVLFLLEWHVALVAGMGESFHRRDETINFNYPSCVKRNDKSSSQSWSERVSSGNSFSKSREANSILILK